MEGVVVGNSFSDGSFCDDGREMEDDKGTSGGQDDTGERGCE